MGIFAGLAPLVSKQYNASLKNGTVLFTDSDVIELEMEGILFEIRYASSLQKKPGKEKVASEGRKSDPFAPPYNEDLYVTEDRVSEDQFDDEGEAFVILLNKFCVLPKHFLLVTKEFQPQTRPLTPGQLVATWSILKQLGMRQKHLAFFNCGAESGASQPHKHLQFIPLSNGVAPFDSFIAEHRPADAKQPFQLPLAYANFTILLSPPPGTSEGELFPYFAHAFLSLLDLMVDHLRRLSYAENNGDNQHPSKDIRLSDLSYNVIITEAYIHLVPRTKETWEFGNGESISINSLGYAGMILTKSESATKAIQEKGKLVEVLTSCGYPPVAPGEMNDVEQIH